MEADEADGQEGERLWALDVSACPARNHGARRAGERRISVKVLRPAPATTA